MFKWIVLSLIITVVVNTLTVKTMLNSCSLGTVHDCHMPKHPCLKVVDPV